MPKLRVDLIALVLTAAALFAVVEYWHLDGVYTNARSLAAIRESGELVVLTQNSPLTYFLDKDGNGSGPEHDLIVSFAEQLGVTPRFEVKNSISSLLRAIAAGEGDVAGAGLSVTAERSRRVLFGPPYRQVKQQVVCRRGGPRPRRLKDLVDVDLVVIAGSSYEEYLKGLKQEYPELSWRLTEGVGAEQLLERIWRRQEQCTIMDSSIIAMNQRYYPELRVRFELEHTNSLAWALPKGAYGLRKAMSTWFKDFQDSGQLAGVNERYFGHVELFDYVDTSAFIRRLRKLYPKYRPTFQAAAEQYGLSEYLLASQSYQESHWNPRAASPTGVRGIMMLTQPTAKAMGVTSRLDAEENIYGGARYLAKLRKRLARRIEEPDLTWFALAAYNVGLGHIRDAQKLARERGKSPYKWHDVKQVLPLLSEPRYYKHLKYGYARGSEPVRYVQQVRDYEQIMLQHLPPPETVVAANNPVEE